MDRQRHRPNSPKVEAAPVVGARLMSQPTEGSRSTFSARAALPHLGAFAAFGIGVSTLYSATGVGFPCPFRLLTGWDCPLCGGTRLGSALLAGDISAAFAYNPVVFVGLLLMSAVGGAWTVEALGGPALRPPRSWRRPWQRLRPMHWLVVGLTLAVIVTVLRNLL